MIVLDRKGRQVGKKDTKAKAYMSDPEHFADAFNYYLFQGRKIVKPEKLEEIDPTEIGIVMKNGSEEVIQKIRDVLKNCVIMKDDRITYIILGIENQSDVHYAMPVRNLIYDALNYGKQVNQIAKKHKADKDLEADEFLSGFSKEDKLKPVITLTTYFGNREWDAPRSLFDMLESVPKELEQFMDDYHLNLIVPSEISDFSLFSTQLRQVLQFISVSDDADALERIATDEAFEHLSVETVDLINECTDANIPIKEGEREVNMCKGMIDLLERKNAEGLAEGLTKGAIQGRIQGRSEDIERMLRSGKSPEAIADFCGYDLAEVKAVADKILAIV